MSSVVLSMNKIDKRFAGVHALKGVDFDLREGEIHALMGENGAGKSTLMKVLTGIHKANSGSITYLNEPFNPKTPSDALDRGIGIIHQELIMMEDLTVAQNIFIGREPVKCGGLLLDKEKLNSQTQKLLDHLGMSSIDPKAKLHSLSVGKQQMVEIAKAVSHDLKVLVLDEPTAALTETEIEELFTIMRELAEKKVAMVYISHRMDEIKRITQRITVMRDGEYVGTRDTENVSKEDIIQMMVGRVIFEDPKESNQVPADAPVVLEVDNLNAGHLVKDISFNLKKGEVLGFAGLMGAGRTETARAIFGADYKSSGTIKINGNVVKIKSPVEAVSNGIGYLSEDRKRFGLATGLSVADNIMITSYEKEAPELLLSQDKIDKLTSPFIEKMKIKTPSIHQLLKNLSGGNQQKVVIAKWLLRDSQILIFDEPTRGIDVGAKSEIYELITELAAMGKSIIMISSELTEILRMSDRIMVMCEGRITGELDIAEATQEKIMKYATMKEF